MATIYYRQIVHQVVLICIPSWPFIVFRLEYDCEAFGVHQMQTARNSQEKSNALKTASFLVSTIALRE